MNSTSGAHKWGGAGCSCSCLQLCQPLPKAAAAVKKLTYSPSLSPPHQKHPPQGWRCDMWDVLAPVRAVRPVNGGAGYDRDLVLDLRTLNFEIG